MSIVQVIVVCSSPKSKTLSKPEPVQTGINVLVQQICDENQMKGSVSDKSTKISRKLAEMILFKISYGPKLNKSKMAVIFKMAAKLEKNHKIVL